MSKPLYGTPYSSGEDGCPHLNSIVKNNLLKRMRGGLLSSDIYFLDHIKIYLHAIMNLIKLSHFP